MSAIDITEIITNRNSNDAPSYASLPPLTDSTELTEKKRDLSPFCGKKYLRYMKNALLLKGFVKNTVANVVSTPR